MVSTVRANESLFSKTKLFNNLYHIDVAKWVADTSIFVWPRQMRPQLFQTLI